MDAADTGVVVYVSGIDEGLGIPENRGIAGEETGDLLNAINGRGICRVKRVLGLALGSGFESHLIPCPCARLGMGIGLASFSQESAANRFGGNVGRGLLPKEADLYLWPHRSTG